jgi:hypothetical protein
MLGNGTKVALRSFGAREALNDLPDVCGGRRVRARPIEADPVVR